jgi:hypothetical protein
MKGTHLFQCFSIQLIKPNYFAEFLKEKKLSFEDFNFMDFSTIRIMNRIKPFKTCGSSTALIFCLKSIKIGGKIDK